MLLSQATLLYRLQTLDLTLAQRRARLAEIDVALGKDESVAAARERLEAANRALKPWQTRNRDLDLEIKSLTQKIQTTNQMLYSGRITNPKECQDLEEEVASLTRRKDQLEYDQIEAMLHIDEEQAAVADAQRALDAAQAVWAGSQTDLLAEQQRLERELVDLEARRNQAVSAIEAVSLSKYEGMRLKKHGQPVALLDGDSCALCGVEQTSMIAQQVRQGAELVYCESCGRILATP
jgi:predicted  nucleic acid-binding Zn-ribbon protein